MFIRGRVTACLMQPRCWVSGIADQHRLDKFWDTTHLDKLMFEIVENETIPSSPKSGHDETGMNFNELKNY